MTIFVKAAKKLILKRLEESIKSADSADDGWFGGWRDGDLSEKQKQLTKKLSRQIEDYVSDESDEVNLAQLKKMILTIDKEVEDLRKHQDHKEATKSKPRGNLNKCLVGTNTQLELFYNTLDRLSYKLIDMPDDADCFHILCAHAAFYFGENIFYPTEEGVLQKAMSVVSGFSSTDIRVLKENCLLHNLTQCSKKLAVFKDGHEDMRITTVLEQIKAIQEGNAKICSSAQVTPSVPLTFWFVSAKVASTSTTVKPSRGRLEVCMQDAAGEIDPTHSILKEATFSM